MNDPFERDRTSQNESHKKSYRDSVPSTPIKIPQSGSKLKGTSYLDKLKGKGGEANSDDKSLPKKLLQSFLMSKYKEMEYLKLRKDYDAESKSYEELLIEEIKKEQVDKLGFYAPHKTSINSAFSNEEEDKLDNKGRDIKKIEFLMKQLKGFVKFMKFNGLDDEHLRIAAHYLKHSFVPKGSYIFKQGEQSRIFYGIIKGKVSLRVRKHFPVTNNIEKDQQETPRQTGISPSHHKTISQTSFIKLHSQKIKSKIESKISIKPSKFLVESLSNQFDPDMEEEIFKVSDGMCFGEWALIYDIPRTASAYAIEDTELFYLDKGCFDLAFHKGISRADSDKKNFLIKRLPSLKLAGKVHDILKKIIPIFCDNKRIIYTELDTAEYVYLIYQGECKLQKLYFDKEPRSKDEIFTNKDRLTSLLILEKGGLAGLELVNPDCKTYKYNLVCNRDQTIVYKISLKVLKECNDNILDYLTPLFKDQEKQLKNFYESFDNYSQRMKISYKPKIAHPLKMNQKELKKNEEEKEKQISEIVEKVRKVKISPKNDLKVKMDVVLREHGYYNKLKKQAKRRGGHDSSNKLSLISRKVTSKGLIENYVRNYINSNCLEDFPGNKNGNSNDINAYNYIQSSMQNFPNLNYISPIKTAGRNSLFYLTQRKNDSIFNTLKSNGTVETADAGYGDIPFLTDNTTKVTISSRDRKNSVSKKYKKSAEKIKINENDEISYHKIEKFKPEVTFKFNTSLKKAQDVKLNKKISSTLSMWSSTMNESTMKFNSGKFNLPLVSVQLSKHSQIL